MRALLSVYDKQEITKFAQTLCGAGFELVSTGGTLRTLREDGKIPVTQVSDLTSFPEILDGRVKTLHPLIHGGILARRDIASHSAQLKQHGIGTIDLVVVNLYPFVDTVSRNNATLEEALENIDIGGPTMIRAAAKNFPHVVIVTDPEDYNWIGERLALEGTKAISLEQRQRLATKAFQHVSLYDTAISQYLGSNNTNLSAEVTLGLRQTAALRYGENPHQSAALYTDVLGAGGIAHARQLNGKELSFNNILDADAAWRVVTDFNEPTVTIVKHGNPCGVASHEDQIEAYSLAFAGDSVSAYGGIVGFNRPVTIGSVEAMRGVFFEVVIAPEYEPKALELLQQRKNLRVLEISEERGPLDDLDVRRISGGFLLQEIDSPYEDPSQWQTMTKAKPTEIEMFDLAFAWKAVKHIKSNAIVVVRNKAVLGIGAGQPNRVNSVHLATRTAGKQTNGGVLASDAFFPFPDNVELAAEEGIKSIIQPGGSIRDDDVIAAANKFGISMVFTGTRHFRH